jgi:hypothetical protein
MEANLDGGSGFNKKMITHGLNPILILAKLQAFDLDGLESDLELADKLLLENLQILESISVAHSLGFCCME